MKKGGRMKTALPTETTGRPVRFPIPESLKEVSAQEPALGGRRVSILKFLPTSNAKRVPGTLSIATAFFGQNSRAHCKVHVLADSGFENCNLEFQLLVRLGEVLVEDGQQNKAQHQVRA